jgi:LuxR family maltose regulon positive regulatory protein
MPDSLLQTKLYLPQRFTGRPRPSFIPRPRLIEKLNAGLDGKLTLVSAPAGFGKTTLVAEWLSNFRLAIDDLRLADPQNRQSFGLRSVRTKSKIVTLKSSWLSLDQDDNDLARFLTYLIAALQTVEATIGQTAVSLLQSHQAPPAETILTLLINDLNRLEGRLVLALDDYHLIANPAIHTALVFLLEHLPPQLHLVIGSRSDPPLVLSRWRARSELTEIRTADLRFTTAEAAIFLRQMVNYPLSAAQVAALTRRTEGWPAGLRLASLSLREMDAAAATHFIADFSGTHHYVLAYLLEEVLQRQPPVVQQFLRHTSILDRLTASLCEALTGLAEAQTILTDLAAHNVFLAPLDETGQWFRYHALFAEALQARLQEAQPEILPELHRRATGWYAANGLTDRAVAHALAAHDMDTAAALIDETAERLWSEGRLATLLSWLNTLPETLVLERPHLCLLHAWVLFLHDRWPEAEQRVQAARRLLDGLPPADPQSRRWRGQLAAVHGAMAAHQQEPAQTVARMQAALDDLPPDDTLWRHVAAIGLGLAQLAQGNTGAAADTFLQAAEACEEQHELYLAFAAWWHRLEACWGHGRLHDVAAALRRLEALADSDKEQSLALRANAAVGFGMLAYEWNDLALAERLLHNALPQLWPGGQPRVVLQAYLALARLHQARGDADQMEQALEQAEQLVRRFNLVAEQEMTAAIAARLWLAQGDRAAAQRWRHNSRITADDPADFRREVAHLTLVRLLLAQGGANEALTLLARLLATAEGAERGGSIIEISLLQALALAQQGRPEQAHLALDRALALAEPEGYARIFLAEGGPLAALLARITPRTAYVAHLLTQLEEGKASGPVAGTPLLDSLTPREVEILRLVAAGATNQQIADHLVVSVGTVKGHLNHILSKLEARNRTEAVARARALNLLQP